MGIVAYCPSGHRVKVKDQFAGKKGICPTCGARFRIPLVSAEESPAAARGSALAAGEPTLPMAAVVSLDPTLAATLPRALPLATVQPAAVTRQTVRPEAVDEEADMLVEAGFTEVPVPAVIAEAPEASWCIALPGGAPSQPMTAGDLLNWLSSGTATGEEVVWRSDWSEWRPARDVFADHMPSGGENIGW